MNKQDIEELIGRFHFEEYQWIGAEKIVISQWVRMKCLFGCDETGRPVCPPNLPSIEVCRELIHEYQNILIFHFTKAVKYGDYPEKWAKHLTRQLLDLEKEIFLSGCHKVFLLSASSCNLCNECQADKKLCKHPLLLRPCPEAMGIDVFETARNCNYPIEVLRRDSKMMNRYAFILIE